MSEPRNSWIRKATYCPLSGTFTLEATLEAMTQAVVGPLRLDCLNNVNSDAAATPVLGFEETWSIATEAIDPGPYIFRLTREFSLDGVTWFLQGSQVIVVPGRLSAIGPSLRRYPAYPYFRVLVQNNTPAAAVDVWYIDTFRAPRIRLP